MLRLILRPETISLVLNLYLVRFCRTQDVFAEESLQACRNIDGRDHARVLLKWRSRRRAALQGLPYSAEHEKTRLLSGL
jgi:hypothetical protein